MDPISIDICWVMIWLRQLLQGCLQIHLLTQQDCQMGVGI